MQRTGGTKGRCLKGAVGRLKRHMQRRSTRSYQGYATIPREPSRAMMEAWFGTEKYNLEYTTEAVDIVRRKLRRVIKAGSR